ncbi:NADH-quinone oxidoreductase subunit J [Roseivirga pacifica]|uniref:NADH-quinone oxidoreductase subunit J family protein n=1 Tax=Roseivirga pacifica TaxID=1267423 RepID=UPI00227B4C17|nr:NADH-quinone oxidoreductase subunit J [Roseivirga pacifica]
MSLPLIIFYFFGILSAAAAIYIALTKNIIYAAFSLILCFIGLAGVFVFLGAEFIAVTQILVYIGGILVLLIFGVMLTNRLKGEKLVSQSRQKLLGFLVSGMLFYVLLKGILAANFSALEWMSAESGSQTGLKTLGMNLMTEYVLAFELIGILLLIALIGAVYIAGNKRKEDKHAA